MGIGHPGIRLPRSRGATTTPDSELPAARPPALVVPTMRATEPSTTARNL